MAGAVRVRLVVGARAYPRAWSAATSARALPKEVPVADELADLDAGAVVGADRQRPLSELHIAGARGLLARQRDLLRKVCRRDDLLGERRCNWGEDDDEPPSIRGSLLTTAAT